MHCCTFNVSIWSTNIILSSSIHHQFSYFYHSPVSGIFSDRLSNSFLAERRLCNGFYYKLNITGIPVLAFYLLSWGCSMELTNRPTVYYLYVPGLFQFSATVITRLRKSAPEGFDYDLWKMDEIVLMRNLHLYGVFYTFRFRFSITESFKSIDVTLDYIYNRFIVYRLFVL